MMWDLPIAVEIDGKEYAIRNKCDYRAVLDTINALTDSELSEREKAQCALYIFYEDLAGCKDLETAIKEMFKIISYEEYSCAEQKGALKLVDWEQDFKVLVAPINRVLSCEIRTVEYLHWWTFVGAYYEIGECLFANIVAIRNKKAKGKKLEKWEEEFYRENRKMVDLKASFNTEEKEFLDNLLGKV